MSTSLERIGDAMFRDAGVDLCRGSTWMHEMPFVSPPINGAGYETLVLAYPRSCMKQCLTYRKRYS